MTLEQINEAISQLPDTQLVSDGYHTFKELYAHRVALFVALCNQRCTYFDFKNDDAYSTIVYKSEYPWKSKLHSDWTMWDWWFIAGIGTKKWNTLTYHLPISEWYKLESYEIPKAPEWDGHTSDDVLRLLGNI